MTDQIIARIDGAVAKLIVNNPAKRNAVSLEMWQVIDEALERYADDPAVRLLVISGAGEKAFVSGADISKFESERGDEAAIRLYATVTERVSHRLYGFPKPTIAKISGVCVGGGLNLAVCCDLRLAAAGSRFAMPAAKLGIGYGYTSLQRLAHVVGLPNALELAFTARLFSAEEALSMSLVQRVVDEGELEDLVDDYADRIAANAPLSIATFKAAAVELRKHESERDFARIDAMVAACAASDDYVEGRRAFMAKRPPAFKGR